MVPHLQTKDSAKSRFSTLYAAAQKAAKHEAIDLMNDSEDDCGSNTHDLDDERKPAAKKYNTGLKGGYSTRGAVNSEDDEKDEDYMGSDDESVVGDDNSAYSERNDESSDDHTITNEESGVYIDDAFFSSTAFADTVEMIGQGEDEHEFITAKPLKTIIAGKMPVAPNMDGMNDEDQKSALAEYRRARKQWKDRRLKERKKKKKMYTRKLMHSQGMSLLLCG